MGLQQLVKTLPRILGMGEISEQAERMSEDSQLEGLKVIPPHDERVVAHGDLESRRYDRVDSA